MPGPDVLVLCYHAISESWRSSLAVTPERLDQDVARIVSRGYAGATLSEAIAAPPATKAVVVSFDDAYRSTRLAAPILARHGVPGTVFAPTSFVGAEEPMRWPGIEEWSDGPDREELLCMSWDELSELAGAGWEVGSHTVSHPRLPELDDSTLDEELTASRGELERRLGRPCTAIAYPYGLWDQRVADAAAAAGYRAGCTLSRWPHQPQPLAWPRVGCYEGDRLFPLKTAAPLRRAVTFLRR
jgi:peptidoglycan/xylan/chitin deacetylase (PgdA/CDA1 family)